MNAAHNIGTLVTRIQDAYLNRPGMALTLEDAQVRFRLDAETSQALFALFVDAGVLVRTGDAYRLRRPAGSRGRHTRAARLQPAA